MEEIQANGADVVSNPLEDTRYEDGQVTVGACRKRGLYLARSITKCNIYGRKCCMGKSYRQLGIEERTMIQTQLELGIKPAAIAVGLKRAASTLSRELSRNGWVRPRARRGPGRPPGGGWLPG